MTEKDAILISLNEEWKDAVREKLLEKLGTTNLYDEFIESMKEKESESCSFDIIFIILLLDK